MWTSSPTKDRDRVHVLQLRVMTSPSGSTKNAMGHTWLLASKQGGKLTLIKKIVQYLERQGTFRGHTTVIRLFPLLQHSTEPDLLASS